ncbi:phage major capsid protein [Paenibacillus melissococcoides]|uniref:phage major capsid protein n=1 Tax=Paenibacillus melissococcoides TaxID=2912268 RepID=UPI0021C455A5|nr:hypothetical protein [Paenibacillus melissococcoides]CAH8719737.1 hypothetical protein HTL2_005706 [Paenibacillus melissococcoides]
MKDEKVTKSVITYSKRWGFTREAFINDDLSMLNRVPRAYVTAAKRGLNRLVYKMLATNPVIFDGKPLFDAAHKNLGTILDVPNEKTMSEARHRDAPPKGHSRPGYAELDAEVHAGTCRVGNGGDEVHLFAN